MRLLCVVVLAACSGTASAPAHPGPAGPDHEPPAPAPSPAPDRTAADCARLIDHAVALGTSEQPGDQRPTAEERTAIATELRTAWTPRCQQMTSNGYACALAVGTLAELDACGG